MSIENDTVARLKRVANRPVETVAIDGETFHVRGFDSHRRAVYLGSIVAAHEQNSVFPDYCVVALGLVNEDGTPVFKETAEGFEALRDLDGAVQSKLALRILDLSKLTKKSLDDAEGK